MEGVGNTLSPEQAAISLHYLMGAYKQIVSSTTLVSPKTSTTICIAKRLQKLEPYYASIDQDYRSYGEDSLLPCMRESIPKV